MMKFFSISASIFALSVLGINALSVANSSPSVANVSVVTDEVTVNDPRDIQDYINSLEE
jgi:hypothetical protein